MEKAAFDRLLQVVRPEQAARLGMQLTSKDPEERKSIVEIDNAEAAQLIAQIYAVDEARYKDRYVAEMRKLATLQSTYVTVGVLPALPTGDYVAAVFRSPGGTSENTLVIVGDQFNEIRVGQALKLLNRSRLRHGEYPVTPVRLYVRGAPPDARALTDDERATARRVISEMRDAQLGQVPGFGRIRSKKLVVGPAKG